jgi:uncharacterized membrane protein (UPF0127 family)
MSLLVKNRTRNVVLADRASIAETSADRRKGLLGRESLDNGEGLWIVPCESIHTFFMNFAIDVVFLSRRGEVLKIRPNMTQWKIALSLRAHSVLELPAGILNRTGTVVGDHLEMEETATGTCQAFLSDL